MLRLAHLTNKKINKCSKEIPFNVLKFYQLCTIDASNMNINYIHSSREYLTKKLISKAYSTYDRQFDTM